MTLLTGLVVFLRYTLGEGSVAMQESITYLHACIFMFGASYALQQGEHVRVDVFYRRFSPTGQAWVNALGTLVFLIPLCIFIFFSSLTYVDNAWAIKETSSNAGGLRYVYLLKSVIPLMAVCLLLQAIGEFLTAAKTLVITEAKA